MASKIVVNLDTSKEIHFMARCKQNDDLTLEAFIYENGLALDLTNKEISIQALKADKTYVIQNTDITNEGNKINANLVRDFSRVPGTTKIEIVLTESSKQNTTFSFYLEVVGSVIRGAVESPNTVTILENLQEKILEAGAVKDETEQLIEKGGAATKGEIQEVNAHLEKKANETDLEIERSRIDLLSKIESGQTEGNAELLDVRVGIDGNTYDVVGNAVRSQLKSIENNTNNKTEYLNENLISSLGTSAELCSLNIKNGAFIVSNGFLTGTGSQTYYKNTSYKCIKGDIFYISLKVPGNTNTQFCICFTNERGKIIASYLPGLSTIKKYEDYKVIAPEGASKIYVQTFLENSEETIVIKKETIENINNKIKKISNNLDNSIGIFKDVCNLTIDNGAINVSNNKISGFGTQTYYKHTTVECSEGDIYYTSLKIPNNVNSLFCVAFTNSNNEIISSYLKGESTTRVVNDYKLITPKGATKLYIQTFVEYADIDSIVLKKERQKTINEILDENEKRGYFKSRQGEFLNVPSNVLASVKYAYEHGYNWIRVSFCHTKDGIPVLLHDAVINNYARNEDGSELSSDVNINSITYEEALKYDFGIYAGTQWKGTKITKLEECIKYCKAVGMRLNIEPKDGDGEKMKKIVDMIYKYCMTDQICFQIDLWSQKSMLDTIAQYSPYINLMPCGNFGTWIVNQTIDNYVNGKREVWIGTYPNDYPSAFTQELYKLCSDNKVKISSPASSFEELKDRFGSCDQIELKNIEYPHKTLKDYVDSII